MSLLQTLSYADYKKALVLSQEHCEKIAKLANLKIVFNDAKKSGELLMKALDRAGFSVQQYQRFLTVAQNAKLIYTYFKPKSKVAILIANEKYKYLSKLVTPSLDCECLGEDLKKLGFIVVIVTNTTAQVLKSILEELLEAVVENSYCFIFYAGHGCELCNTKCMLSIDCPSENITLEHCVTENFVLREVAKCKPELCVLIMDMCRLVLDRNINQDIFTSIPFIEDYTIHNNLLISYSTQSSAAAYEVLQIECSHTIDNNVTYELKTGDTGKIVPVASQYTNALCNRLKDDVDVSSMLDRVHADVENSMRKQRPIKVQCGAAKRSLYDPVTGDITILLKTIKEIEEKFKENCNVL